MIIAIGGGEVSQNQTYDIDKFIVESSKKENPNFLFIPTASKDAQAYVKIIDKLYEASRAGVKIELIVRGICVLIPGIPGVSDNITVRSIVGRFLEHSRIFWFQNGGREDIYIGSADWMPRNLNDRVELMVPVSDEELKQRVKKMILLELADNQKAYAMQSDGTWIKNVMEEDRICAQEIFQQIAEIRGKENKLTLAQKMEPYVPLVGHGE